MPGNLQSIPASVLASWPKPNYVDPHRRTWLIPYACTLQAIMTLMVGTRCWLRFRQKAGPLGLDDAFLIPAFLAATWFTTLLILGVKYYGADRHVWDVPYDLFETTALVTWLSELAFLISTCCTKVSVLLFYRRLTKGTFSKRWRYATIAAIAFTVAYCLAFVLVLIFNCHPTEAYWKSFNLNYTGKYTCTSTTVLNPVSGVLSCLSDLYAVLLPMGMLRHFDAPKRQKAALNGVFSLGLLVVAAGAVRTYYLYRLGFDYDLTWVGYDTFVWSDLEVQLAIICASAPALRVFFRTYLSDPLSKAINTARSTTGNRSANRNSQQTDQLGPMMYASSHRRDSSHGSGTTDDKGLIKHSVKPCLDTVGEHDLESAPSIRSHDQYVIKTPADYEVYALQNLERHRPPPSGRRSPSIQQHFGDMSSTLSGPFTDWHAPPT